VDPASATEPASGLIPYAPHAELWSDGATSRRRLSVPDDSRITPVDGDWELPLGSVLIQNLALDGRLVETRLLMHHPDGVWVGYTYEWNDAQTAATRVRDGKVATIGSHSWVIPSEGDCLRCHTIAAGRSLGLETAQLNGDLLYPATGRTANQLATLDAIGVLDASLPADLTTLPALSDPTDAGEPLESRARAWLHANCSGCHRPDGTAPTALDLRHDTALAATAACDTSPQRGDLGLPDARIIAPGAPERSVLLERVARRDGAAMPPLGSLRVDEAAVSLLTDWIASLSSCD
jgi:uncharacterized repeat protein (TIGR03806 family)